MEQGCHTCPPSQTRGIVATPERRECCELVRHLLRRSCQACTGRLALVPQPHLGDGRSVACLCIYRRLVMQRVAHGSVARRRTRLENGAVRRPSGRPRFGPVASAAPPPRRAGAGQRLVPRDDLREDVLRGAPLPRESHPAAVRPRARLDGRLSVGPPQGERKTRLSPLDLPSKPSGSVRRQARDMLRKRGVVSTWPGSTHKTWAEPAGQVGFEGDAKALFRTLQPSRDRAFLTLKAGPSRERPPVWCWRCRGCRTLGSCAQRCTGCGGGNGINKASRRCRLGPPTRHASQVALA